MPERTPNRVNVIQEIIAFPYATDRMIANLTYGLTGKELEAFMEESKLPMRLMLPVPETTHSPKTYAPRRVHSGSYPFVHCSGYAESFFRQYLRHNSQIRFNIGSEVHQLPEAVRHFLDVLKIDPDNPHLYQEPPTVSIDFRTEQQIKTDTNLKELMNVCGFDYDKSRDITGESHDISHGIDSKELAALIEKSSKRTIPVGWNGGLRDPEYPYGNYFQIPQFYLTRIPEGLRAGLLRPTSWNGGYRDFGLTFAMDPPIRKAA